MTITPCIVDEVFYCGENVPVSKGMEIDLKTHYYYLKYEDRDMIDLWTSDPYDSLVLRKGYSYLVYVDYKDGKYSCSTMEGCYEISPEEQYKQFLKKNGITPFYKYYEIRKDAFEKYHIRVK